MSANVGASVVVVVGGCVVVEVDVVVVVEVDVVVAGAVLVVADVTVVATASGTEPVPHPAAKPAHTARVTTLVRPLDIGCISVA